jgi:ELWxxDGT repeat protein
MDRGQKTLEPGGLAMSGAMGTRIRALILTVLAAVPGRFSEAEERVVLIKDIYPGMESPTFAYSSMPSGFLIVGNTLYFTANDGAHGYELWKSDGTPGGTVMIKDINPGGFFSNSSPSWLTSGPLHIYFTAKTDTYGEELWVTNGTEAGTYQLKDINPGTTSSKPQCLTVVGRKVFFSAYKAFNRRQLWTSDGTLAGTNQAAFINPDDDGMLTLAVNPADAPITCAVGNRFFFRGRSGEENGWELWASTGSGAYLVKEIGFTTATRCPWFPLTEG